jgi:hypothetical protein
MNYWKQSKDNVWVAAHRGWCSKYPENTMEAIRAAVELGVDQIETDIRVRGESNSYIGFAIDLENEEIVVINSTNNSGCRVVSLDDIAYYSDYLDPRYLEIFNMGRIISARGEVVETPEEADIIFTSDIKIKPAEGQKLVRPYDVDYLVSFLNIK